MLLEHPCRVEFNFIELFVTSDFPRTLNAKCFSPSWGKITCGFAAPNGMPLSRAHYLTLAVNHLLFITVLGLSLYQFSP